MKRWERVLTCTCAVTTCLIILSFAVSFWQAMEVYRFGPGRLFTASVDGGRFRFGTSKVVGPPKPLWQTFFAPRMKYQTTPSMLAYWTVYPSSSGAGNYSIFFPMIYWAVPVTVVGAAVIFRARQRILTTHFGLTPCAKCKYPLGERQDVCPECGTTRATMT